MMRALLLVVCGSVAMAEDVPQAKLLDAAKRGLALLVETSPTFIKKGGCNSCHNQMLPAVAQAFARKHGVDAGPVLEMMPPETNEFTMERLLEYNSFGPNSLGYELFSYAGTGRPGDTRIHALMHVLKSSQQPAGHWVTPGNRPPLTVDDYSTTAFAIHALKIYAAEGKRADHDARIARARSWLLEAKPGTVQERAFQVLGLAWSKASAEAIAKAARGLQSMQAKDGGWSQLPAMPNDAYATGLALWALYEGGVSTRDAAYQSGLKWLLQKQAADGTWLVKTRALPVQPYFESGYPYGHDQWISAAGAAYATMAISAAIEPQRTARR